MRANVYFPYTVLSRCARAVYGAISKWRSRNNLTDGVGFEPTLRDYRKHTFQASPANASNRYRRSVSVVTSTLLRSLRSRISPRSPTRRIQTVYSVPSVFDQPMRLLVQVGMWW
jgi:hypothetical protein